MRFETKEFPHGFRIQGLVIKDGKVLLMHRVNHGHEYYILPGGGLEEGESQEEGVKREVWEEMTTEVKVLNCLFSLTILNDSRHIIYLCKYISGEPKLGDFNEKETMKQDPENTYESIWFDAKKIKDITLYPLEFKDWLLENIGGLDSVAEPYELTIKLNQLRH